MQEIVRQPYIAETLVVGCNHALDALVVPDCDAMKADGISEEKVQKVIEDGVFALNAKLPVYSQIAICELRHDPFVKTPKLSIKRFMYN